MKKALIFLLLIAGIYAGFRWYKKRREEQDAPDFAPSREKKRVTYKKLSDSEIDKTARAAAQILPSLVVNPDTKNMFLSGLLTLQKESLKAISTRFQLSYSIAGQSFTEAIQQAQAADEGLKNKVIQTLNKIA